ncbi:MAG TPA: nucleobase:cation symporter-2 family protein [Burkholderiales bacterium]|nr:nucleobase:cation symporter-2 family protein [Burkholderiales bacterium]
MSATDVHPVDAVLPPGQMFLVGLQHVLVMYAGAIAVPLIVGGALKLPKDQLALLINADLFACGVATLIQCIGVWKFGIRLPVVMGVTFAAVGPLVAMANAGLNAQAMYGAVIVAGIATMLVAPVFSRLLRFFPPVVTGTIIAVIGITLLRVGITWAGGGTGAKPFGAIGNLSIALVVLISILAVNKYLRGFWANISVLLGLVVGFLLALPLDKVNLTGVAEASWFAIVLPFSFGFPEFEFGSIISLCLVMFVVMVESTGMFLALGEVTKRSVTPADLTRGLRADGLGTVIGGIFNTFPYTSFSQNVGLVGVTGVRSRWVVAVSGGILIALGLVPKLATLVASIPQAVLGGAGIAMFGMVAATGIKILSRVDFENRSNLLIVAISIGAGMIPLVSPAFFDEFPKWTGSLTHSGITLTAIVAVALNAFLNGAGKAADGNASAVATAVMEG